MAQRTETGLKDWLMVTFTSAIFHKESSMGQAHTNGKMAVSTKDNSPTESDKAREYGNLTTATSLKASTQTT